jgi:nucleotide-binding universal stress UspA family protein
MFAKILHANDGSTPAFNALELALKLAQQNEAELHMVSVMEVDYLPEFVEEIREETGRAARRFRGILQRAQDMAEQSHIKLHTHPGIRSATSSSSRPTSGPTSSSSAPPAIPRFMSG